MDAMEAILTRRSIRKYASEAVSHEIVNQLLAAAMSAPTAGNEPWHFVVLRERSVLEAFTKFHPHALMLKTAAVGILVCGDPTVEMLKGRWLMDCSAATENMLIAANALGLGAVWVGIYPVEERIQGVRELLGVPAHVIPLSLVSWAGPEKGKAHPIASDRSGFMKVAGNRCFNPAFAEHTR